LDTLANQKRENSTSKKSYVGYTKSKKGK